MLFVVNKFFIIKYVSSWHLGKILTRTLQSWLSCDNYLFLALQRRPVRLAWCWMLGFIMTREQGWGSQDWGGEEWQTVHHITITRRCRRNNKHSIQITRKLIKTVLSQFKVYNCHSPTPPPTGTSSVLISPLGKVYMTWSSFYSHRNLIEALQWEISDPE